MLPGRRPSPAPRSSSPAAGPVWARPWPSSSAGWGRRWASCRGARSTGWPGWPPSRRSGAGPPRPAPTSATPTRWPPPSTPSKQALGPAGVLVNNAAANFPVPAEDLSANGWRAVTQIVLDGTFFCSQELYRRATAPASRGPSATSWPPSPSPADRAWPTGGGQGRGGQPDQDAGGRVGARTGSGSTPWRRGSSPTRTCGPTSRRCAPRARRSTPAGPRPDGSAAARAGLGRHLAVLALRRLRHRPHPGGRRGQLVTPGLRHARVRSRAGADRRSPGRPWPMTGPGGGAPRPGPGGGLGWAPWAPITRR